MALTWNHISPPPGDDRVNVWRAVAGHLQLTSYAFEPYEDRHFFDVEAVGLAGASCALVFKRGHYATKEAAQRQAALDGSKLAKLAYDAIGTVK